MRCGSLIYIWSLYQPHICYGKVCWEFAVVDEVARFLVTPLLCVGALGLCLIHTWNELCSPYAYCKLFLHACCICVPPPLLIKLGWYLASCLAMGFSLKFSLSLPYNILTVLWQWNVWKNLLLVDLDLLNHNEILEVATKMLKTAVGLNRTSPPLA